MLHEFRGAHAGGYQILVSKKFLSQKRGVAKIWEARDAKSPENFPINLPIWNMEINMELVYVISIKVKNLPERTKLNNHQRKFFVVSKKKFIFIEIFFRIITLFVIK